MKRTGALLGSTVLAATVAWTSAAGQTTPVQGLYQHNPTLIALTNASLVTEPGQRIENATLVIEHGKIRSIERNNRAPAGARVIDASGYTLYPGFVDPFSNYGVAAPGRSQNTGRSTAPQYTNEREGGNASNMAIHAEREWFSTFKADKDSAKGYVEQGFTTVQSARLDGIFQGRGTTVSLADTLPNFAIYNPRTRQFASFDKGSSTQQYPNSLMGSIALIRQTLSDARWYGQSQGLQGSEGRIEFNAALAALQNLQEQGVIFHTTNEQDLLRAARVFGEFEVPITAVGSGFEYSRVAEIKASNARLILPLDFPAAPDLSEQFSELDVPIADLRHWERAPANPAILAGEGIEFAFTLHGMERRQDFWPNVRKAVEHGLSEQRALAALTTVPARMAGVADQSGKIAPGFHADFVVARGNLFEDGEIVSVWLRGEETRLKAMHPSDVSGTYTFSFDSVEFTLELQDNDRLQGSLKVGDESTRLLNAAKSDDRVRFSADLTELGMPGIFRFSLESSALNQLTGTVQDAMGRVHGVSAQASGEAREESTSSERTSSRPEYVGQMTFPNIAFGRTATPEQQNLHIRNATVWTADDQGILENADIIVRNGQIQRVGQNLSTPRGYTVIDATGMHVTPGIIDEHSHIAISRGVNEGTEAITSEVRIGDVVNPDDIHIYRSLAGGTTVAHLLHGSANPIGGQGQTIKLRWGESAENMKFTQTPPTIKMALGENVKQSNWGDLYTVRYPQTRMGVATLIQDAFQQAREYQQAKRDYERLSRAERRRTAPPRTDYRLEALAEILDNERHTHVHSYVASEVLALMDVVEQLGFRIHTFTHILEGYKVAQEMAEHGARASSFADWWAFKFEAYDAIPHNMCLMMDAGVLTSINSDSNDLQRRMNTEAAKSVRYCGMDEHEAFKMITLYPAKQLEIDRYVGSITAGKHADLVFWNAHPLSAYAQVQQTWIEGRKFFDREEDQAKREALEQERQALIQKVLAAGAEANRGNRSNYRQQQPTWHCEDNHDVWLDWFGAHGHTHGHNHAGGAHE
ncbi:amidohydrolase family protein [Aliidiomarina sanyensis]|uniref:Amidohydrolase n=1 Tax=Aliidiomarina sanyensis TaxID=1249555 RepID=A0A432WNC0_9GAMM|nr:amidohydrolase family protein [Aliidiomarina sanyensis]RUO35275.1 amidohydrolase [Aliidiomarina sanyensis]